MFAANPQSFSPNAEISAPIKIDELFLDSGGKSTPEIYVGDDIVLERLSTIMEGIKNGSYDEETKQAIYYYTERFTDTGDSSPSEYMEQVRDFTKFFVTGWWVHELCNSEEKTDTQMNSLEQ